MSDSNETAQMAAEPAKAPIAEIEKLLLSARVGVVAYCKGREAALVTTKIDEALLWLTKVQP